MCLHASSAAPLLIIQAIRSFSRLMLPAEPTGARLGLARRSAAIIPAWRRQFDQDRG